MNRKLMGIAVSSALVIATAVGIGWYQSAFADGSDTTPGSANDPIVTKGYVDQKVEAIVKQELEKQVPTEGASAKLEVVTVPLGSKIVVDDGGELIVRNGKALAYSTDANGLSDMTDGRDIAPGKAVATNHLILFPRGGRGVQADPKQKNGLIVLVRGKYELNN
jgi:hypothetical protein